MNRKAFTFIELLIVIAIIAVLIVLLIPVIEAARANAKYVKFKNSFGEINREYLENPDGKSLPIIQKWIDKKMTELAKKYIDAKNGVSWEEAIDPSNLEEVNVALIKLKEGETVGSHTLDVFNTAKKVAKAYKLKVKENPEDYIKE